MSKIKAGLVGVVYALTASREVVALRAGDTVPEGVNVGAHVLDVSAPVEAAKPTDVVPAEPKPVPAAAPKRRGRPPKVRADAPSN